MTPDTLVHVGDAAAGFDWNALALSVILMIIMSFFCTGGVELFKDIYYYWLLVSTSIANRYRTPDKVKIVKEEDKYFSNTTSKFISFLLAFWMCIAFNYGAIQDIIQYDVHSFGWLAEYTDYFLTASIIRLGAIQVYDLLAMLTEKALAAKRLAASLTATTIPASSSATTDKTVTTELHTTESHSSASDVKG
jgi:hypothetical protein